MPRGVPKSGSTASSIGATSVAYPTVPPPTRSTSTRSAKLRANASILEHDTDIDALIRKHDKKGARGFAPSRTRKTAARLNDETKTGDTTTTIEEQDENKDVRTSKRSKGEAMVRTEKANQEAEMDADANTKAKTAKLTKTRARAAAKSSRKAEPKQQQSDENVKAVEDPSTRPHRAVLVESKTSQSKGETSSTRPISIIDKQEGPSSSTPPPKKANKDARKANSSPERKAAKLASSSSPRKRRGLPEIQIASFLENYDLESENRLRMAHKTLQISIDSARTQMHAKAIARLPRSVRLMRLGDFIDDYGADVQAAIERAAMVANKAREGDWEEEKLQRKRKGSADDSGQALSEAGERKLASKKGKIDEEKEKAASTSSKRVVKSVKRAVSRKLVKSTQAKSPEPVSSTPTSSVRPPSSATFTPQLNRHAEASTPATGRARNARTGEQVQWTSMNGSPIIGVIAPDGTIHAMPRTMKKTPFQSAKASRNWQPVYDDDSISSDAETSATHVLELVRGIDLAPRAGQHKGSKLPSSKIVRQPVPAATSVNASPVSLHTAQASRRGTMEALDSDDGGSVFEEARSRPSELDDGSMMRDPDDSLPDEEAYMAQIMREEAEKRAKMLASEPRAARSSSSSRAAFNGSRSSSGSSAGGHNSRASHSTIRANTSTTTNKKLYPSSNIAAARSSHSSASVRDMPSSPMVRNKSGGSSSNRLLPTSTSAAVSSSSPSTGRVSVMLESGTQHMLSGLSVDDLMRLPSHERNQMIAILEKLKRSQT
jgi:hypothetical protein